MVHQKSKLRSGAGGFTLIELLVVIAIIATLAAILFPIFTSARATSKRVKCTNNIKQVYNAWNMYIQDWGGRVPKSISGAIVGWGEWQPQNNISLMGWTEKLFNYTKNIQLYKCPMTKLNYTYAYNYKLGANFATSIEPVCPSRTICIFEVPSYDEKNPLFGRAKINIAGANNAKYTGDSDLTNDNQEDGWVYGERDRPRDGHPIEDEALCPNQPPNPNKHFGWLYFPGRHSGGNNICFSDGHVQWFGDWDSRRMTIDPNKNPGILKVQ